jgi:hypothetical protein
VRGLDVSYVIATDRFETVRDVVRAVADQTIRDRIELVLVCPSEAELALEPEVSAGIGAVRVLEVESLVPVTEACAAGILGASAPLVFVGETHSFPEPDCLERLLATHARERYAAVMPLLVNGNPRRASSWANLMVTYRDWLAPASGEIASISTHNVCFRRDLLIGYGDRLAEMLDFGSGLDGELRAQGYGLLVEPAARLPHLNVATLGAWVADRFLVARIYADAKARRWSRPRRLAYSLAGPIIPALIVARVLRSQQWSHHRSSMPAGTLAGVVLSAVVIAAGEVAGYLTGSGSAPRRIAKYEVHRARYA